MYLAPQMRLAALGQQGMPSGQFGQQTRLPGGTSYEDMRFTGVARPQGGFGLRGDTAPEMFRDRLTGELVTKEQVDSLGGMETLLSPRQKTRVLDNDRANLLNMQAAQERAAMQPIIQDRRARMDVHLAPPTRPGGMENLSGSLGGQIRPSPYSAPQMPQMGGGYGGGQGMQQFMQFMQTMMQMFQQLQGGGMSGGFQGQMRPRPQTYGRSPYGGY